MVYQVIDIAFQVYTILLFARVLGSWIPEFRDHKLMHFVAFYTDPYLNLFRRFIPPLGMIDISPIIAFLVLGLTRQFLHSLFA